MLSVLVTVTLQPTSHTESNVNKFKIPIDVQLQGQLDIKLKVTLISVVGNLLNKMIRKQ